MLLWVYTHTGQAWKICLATVGFEPTTFGRGQVGSSMRYFGTESSSFDISII
jgi:hypothetical protein